MNRSFSLKGGWPRAGAFALALGMLGAPVHAGLFDDNDARRAILEMRQHQEQERNESAARQARINEQLDQMRRSLLELNNQLDLTRGEIARLRGQNEQLAREVSEVQRRQADLTRGLDDRLQKIEPQKVSVDGREILVTPEERREYEAALEIFRKGDFANAATAFAAFQRRYPSSGYRSAVSYWLGNALYGKRDYREAMAEFRSLVTSAPTHPRVPEALLSIAMCQIELKDRPAARKTLDELIKDHPQTEAAKEAKLRLAALR